MFLMIQTESETDSNPFVNLPDVEKEPTDESGILNKQQKMTAGILRGINKCFSGQ